MYVCICTYVSYIIHNDITTHQGYLSIETRATAVFTSKCVVPSVVCMSRYLDKEKNIGTYVCMFVYIDAYMH